MFCSHQPGARGQGAEASLWGSGWRGPETPSTLSAGDRACGQPFLARSLPTVLCAVSVLCGRAFLGSTCLPCQECLSLAPAPDPCPRLRCPCTDARAPFERLLRKAQARHLTHSPWNLAYDSCLQMGHNCVFPSCFAPSCQGLEATQAVSQPMLRQRRGCLGSGAGQALSSQAESGKQSRVSFGRHPSLPEPARPTETRTPGLTHSR